MSFAEFDNDFLSSDEFIDNNLQVDFSDINMPPSEKKKENDEIKYDHTTREKYKALRFRKMDPISFVELEDQYAFKFRYKWDPYTGERLIGQDKKWIEDENGPLCFDPDVLIKNYYVKRLDKLWIKPSDEQNGLYAGHYDDAVGAGEDFYVTGRGHHPEWYMFRIPIIDCYLTEHHNNQHITLGPKLTNDEINELERLANLRLNNYRQMYGVDRPSLLLMKKLYDNAISKTPVLENINADVINNLSKSDLQELYDRANRKCVDQLSKLRG